MMCVCVCVSAIMPGAHNGPQPAVTTNPWAGSGTNSRVPDPTMGSAPLPPPQPQPSPSNPFVGGAHNGAPAAAYASASPTQQQQQLQSQQHQQQQHQQRLQEFQHSRSHSIDTGELAMPGRGWAHPQQPSPPQPQQQSQKPTLLSMVNQGGTNFQQHNGAAGSWAQAPLAGTTGATGGKSQGVDPFDVAWAAKAVNKSSPFGGKQVKQFEVQL